MPFAPSSVLGFFVLFVLVDFPSLGEGRPLSHLNRALATQLLSAREGHQSISLIRA